MSGWWVLLAGGVALYGTPGLLQLRAAAGERLPGLGWRVEFRRLPVWAAVLFFAGIFLTTFAATRLTAGSWRGPLLAVGCFAVPWLVQLALVRASAHRAGRVRVR